MREQTWAALVCAQLASTLRCGTRALRAIWSPALRASWFPALRAIWFPALDTIWLPALRAARSRSTSPCGGDGVMVWRRWAWREVTAVPAGEDAAPPVVFLHGGSGAWTHWIRNIDALAQRRTLWIADLPGCSESSLPPGAVDADGIYDTVGTGIAHLLDTLNISSRQVDLVGFSFGSLVAGYVAAHYPHLIRRLILIAPPALGMRSAPLGLRSLSVAASPAEHEAAVRHNLMRLMLHDPAALDDLAVAMHAANFTRDRLRRRRISSTEVMLELQRRWQCPVHVLAGGEDPLLKPELARLPEVLAGCDLRQVQVIAGAGHWVQYERPEEANRALAAMLA